jgi:hypothetical protein
MSPARSPSHDRATFWLKIELQHVAPLVWRRLLVPGGVRLDKLSDIFQATMGWNNSHLHAFLVGDVSYGMLDDDEDGPDDQRDETEVTVHDALSGQQRLTYKYDYGDGWEHEVTVEDMGKQAFGLKYAVCLEGENACPPDDVGGPSGYGDFLAAIADPTGQGHRLAMEWSGGSFDPAAFDLVATNAELQRIR